MSHTPVGGYPQGWDQNKLADRSSLPPVPGEERGRSVYAEHLGNLNRYHGSGSKGVTVRRNAGAGGEVLGGPRSPPAHVRWAQNLRDLLEDAEGVRLFQWFVREAGPSHADRLDFYFACQGLKQQRDPLRIKSMVAAIYKFLRKSELTIPENVRRRIKLGLKDEDSLDSDIFDSMQAEVEKEIKDTTYLSFLHSDTYLQHAQAAQLSTSTPSSGSVSSASSNRELCSTGVAAALATLHEGEELASAPPARLTRDLLMATQRRRLQPETFSGVFGKNYSVYSHPHLSYSAYCPTSRQDSELQSMSSGRTDSDALSMSGSSVDGISLSRSAQGARREHSRHLRAIMQSANMNRETHTQAMVISRTFRSQKGQVKIMKPEEFAPLLIEKLEKVRRDQDNQEKLDRKLMENDEEGPSQAIPPRMVAAALREKLQLDDDNDQDILDQHVSRVWSDQTPARSPARPPSPPHHSRRYAREPHRDVHPRDLHPRDVHSRELHPHDLHPRDVHPRDVHPRDVHPRDVHPRDVHPRDVHPRDVHPRDLHSTLSAQSALSADSGNVRDFGDASSSERTGSNVSIGKSRSVPDYNDPFLRQTLGRKSSSRKTLTEITDSGVSVVSDASPHPPVLPGHQPDSRILMWIQEGANNTDRYGRRTFSRSGSAERPGQPVATDPQMPPLPGPHTPTQLDEARRRLLQDHTSLPPPPPLVPRHPKRSSGGIIGKAGPEAPCTVVVFTFLEEQFPYRTKIPAAPVTLRQFKEYLPKKGNYRYFFKTQCEELENTVIQEEIFNDSDYLPLWDGKIMARVKNVE